MPTRQMIWKSNPAINLASISQESAIQAFRSLYPRELFEGFSFPMIEDLVNNRNLQGYSNWLKMRGIHTGHHLGPNVATKEATYASRSTLGNQIGAITHKAAHAQLVSFQLTEDEHFAESLEVGARPAPTEQTSSPELDLEYAAYIMVTSNATLNAFRKETLAVIAELKHRWQGVTAHIRKSQPEGINKVTIKRDIGLVAILIIILGWPDLAYANQLVTGLPVVGYRGAKCTGK